jgi:translation initiation factor 3 subunit E
MNLSALWGKLASEILDGNWDGALEAVQELKENIDKTVRKPCFLLFNLSL